KYIEGGVAEKKSGAVGHPPLWDRFKLIRHFCRGKSERRSFHQEGNVVFDALRFRGSFDVWWSPHRRSANLTRNNFAPFVRSQRGGVGTAGQSARPQRRHQGRVVCGKSRQLDGKLEIVDDLCAKS